MEQVADQVLIVDDDRDIGRLLSTLMNKGGLASQVAYDGETALRIFAAGAPDLMLVDVNMPGIDGMEVLKRVKELDPRLPVVLITAFAEISGLGGGYESWSLRLPGQALRSHRGDAGSTRRPE